MKNFISQSIRKATLYYTILIVTFSLIMLISNSSEDIISLDPTRVMLFLPFCFSFAIANTTLQQKSIEAVTRWGVHFALTVISAFLFIILPAKLQSSSGNFIGLMIIIVLYFFGILLYNLFSHRIKATLEQDKRLKSQIKNGK